jgi:hypothetical protein
MTSKDQFSDRELGTSGLRVFHSWTLIGHYISVFAAGYELDSTALVRLQSNNFQIK